MKNYSPICDRNKREILKIIEPYVNKVSTKKIFEIGSYTCQHAIFFLRSFPQLIWQPSEIQAQFKILYENYQNLQSENLLEPILLTNHFFNTHDTKYDYFYSSMTTHYMSNQDFVKIANFFSKNRKKDALLFLYGVFKRNGNYHNQLHESTDRRIKQEYPRSGIKDIDFTIKNLKHHNFTLISQVKCKNDNLMLIFKGSKND